MYDPDGRLVETIRTSTPDPEYDDTDREMYAALTAWREDLHSCGRPLSESLHDPDQPNDEQIQYVVGTQVCRACQALDRRHAQRTEEDKALVEAGRTPSSWRLDVVVPVADAAALVAAGEASQK